MTPVPPIKSAWLSIQCWPDEKTPALMRLKIDLELNGEKHQSLIDTIFDPKSGNGIICQHNNLGWMFKHAVPNE